MKKIILIIIVILIVISGSILWYRSLNNNQKNANVINNTPNYQAERSSTNENTNSENINNNMNSTEQNQTINPKKETEIAQFSTKIYNKESERQNNITITCKTLSKKEILPGETFSFCNTVGKATSEKGYQEADIYVKGEKKKGLGGGNCQVSTTLYNAVLKVPELEVIERHKHSGKVPYIQDGNDAAVAYGAYDFKFKNNTNKVIKLIMENTTDNITAKLMQVE